MSSESTIRRTALQYVETELYDDVEATFVGMSDTPQGTRVGLEIERNEPSLAGAVLGLLFGAIVGTLVSLILVFVFPPLMFLVIPAAAIGGAYLGYEGFRPSEYATVTVDDAGDVVMSNRDCPEGDFNDMLDRTVSAQGQRAYLESLGERRGASEPTPMDVVDGFLFDDEDDGYSEPERCPRCSARNTGLSSQFSELATGQFQCTDCGYVVDLTGD